MFSADLGGITASSTPASNDPPFQKVALLLHGDGTNGAQNNTFVDSSTNNFTITRTGNVAQGTFSPFAPSAAYDTSTNGGSGYFDGSGDYLSAPDSTSLQVLGSAFTIECWFYLTSTPPVDAGLISKYDGSGNGYILRLLSAGTGIRWYAGNSGYVIIDRTYSFALNTWYHVAVTCDGTNTAIFVNGVKQGASGGVATNNSTATLQVGLTHTVTNYFPGYISNVRVVKGTDVYGVGNSSFTVPTAPLTAVANTQLLLNCTNAGIIDNAGKNDIETVGNAQVSTSVKKYGTGSMYFDGTGDYLALPTNQNFAMGTGDFTIECWAYAASGGTNNGIWMLSNSYGVNTTYQLAVTFTLPNIFVNANGTSAFTSGVTISTGNWYHLALVRSSNTTKLYVDGVSRITFASDSTNYTHTYLTIGGYYSTGYLLNGYIDDLRITKGQALYTANFTPPTQAFPNV